MIDFLGGLIVRVKNFPFLNPQNLQFSAHFWTEIFAQSALQWGRYIANYP